MFLKVINTGSQGNGYALRGENETLLIEAGIPYKDVLPMLDFDVSTICGQIITHSHQDHFKYHKQYEKLGIEIFKPWQRDVRTVKFGGFKVQAMQVPHDDEIECYGYYITHESIGNLVFLTDLSYCPFDLSKLRLKHIMVECNYDTSMIDVEAPNFRHKVQGHMSLQTCKEFVKHNRSPDLKNVILIHSSAETLDFDKAVAEVKSVVDADVNVVIAHKGMEIELTKEGF